jgi:hypothetical protein
MRLHQSSPLLLELYAIVRERILYLLTYVTSSSLSMGLQQSPPLLLELQPSDYFPLALTVAVNDTHCP